MNPIGVMTFNVRQCRGRDGRIDPERILRVIDQSAPDIVALQEVESSFGSDHLSYLGNGLRMSVFGPAVPGGNAYLSRFPLKGIQQYSLGNDGICLKADLDLLGKRVHLFNVRLHPSPFHQYHQLKNLFGSDLVGNPYFPCSKLILGDFGAFCPWFWNLPFLSLGRLRRPLWRLTYPSWFPLFSRDRVYHLGDIEVLHAAVVWNPLTRSASSHLPLNVTVNIRDNLDYLHAEQIRGEMGTAAGCFRKKAALR